MTLGRWVPLDGGQLTDVEHDLADQLVNVVDRGNVGTVMVEALDINAQPTTTVLVINRPCENLLLVIRADRSVLVATDDIYADRWCDA